MTTRREFVTVLSLAPLALSRESRPSTGFVYDEIYLDHELHPDHPESPERLRRILLEMKREGLDQEVTPISRLGEPLPHIEAHHTAEHVAGIQTIETTGRVAKAAVGGALAAVSAVSHGEVRNAFCAIRPPGHHANNTGDEEGFCFYSNAAIAAKYAQSVFGYEKILIIDWDYHHGNGTQNAFYDDPTVLFYSSHDWQAYPGTGDPSLEGKGEGSGLNIQRPSRMRVQRRGHAACVGQKTAPGRRQVRARLRHCFGGLRQPQRRSTRLLRRHRRRLPPHERARRWMSPTNIAAAASCLYSKGATTSTAWPKLPPRTSAAPWSRVRVLLLFFAPTSAVSFTRSSSIGTGFEMMSSTGQ